MLGSEREWISSLIGLLTRNALTTSPVIAKIHAWAEAIAGIFVLIALLLSIFLIVEHLSWYNNPDEQKFLVGVIFIVPLYATESFFSLCSSKHALEWEIVRDCYEALALYAFWRYLIACLGGDEKTIDSFQKAAVAGPCTPLLDSRPCETSVRHIFPLNVFLKPWVLGQEFFDAVKFGIVQYMILKTFCAFLAIVLEQFNAYGEGHFQWNKGYAYVAIVMNFSQSWALYCLVQFYNVTREDLAPIKPLAKFLCFKSIIFLTWWQGLVIDVLFALAALRNLDYVKANLQDFLICIEMGFAAASHIYVFPAKPYRLMHQPKFENASLLRDCESVDSLIDLEDVKDVKRPYMVWFFQEDVSEGGTSVRQSAQDVVFKGGQRIVEDVKFTIEKVGAPVQKRILHLNDTFHHVKENVKHRKRNKRSNDDIHLCSGNSKFVFVKGINEGDDGLLSSGSTSDSEIYRVKKRKQATVSWEE